MHSEKSVHCLTSLTEYHILSLMEIYWIIRYFFGGGLCSSIFKEQAIHLSGYMLTQQEIILGVTYITRRKNVIFARTVHVTNQYNYFSWQEEMHWIFTIYNKCRIGTDILSTSKRAYLFSKIYPNIRHRIIDTDVAIHLPKILLLYECLDAKNLTATTTARYLLNET